MPRESQRNSENIRFRMKKQLYLCCAALLLLQCACAAQVRQENINEHTLMPEGASVAGVNISRVRFGSARSSIAQALGEPVFTFVLPEEELKISAAELGIRYDIDATLTAVCHGEDCRYVSMIADETVLQARLSRIAAKYRTAAGDASVAIDRSSGQLFQYTPETVGREVALDALTDRIHQAMQAGELRVTVPCATIAPEVTVVDIQKTRQPVASFTTSFSSYPQNNANRIFNIKKAAKAIHGITLAPGEQFDCNAALGDRNAENGWREAAGIRNGAYVNEYGGGVCQVSSTLFNAVMMADLTVTERSPHSWPMGYIGIGRDATISTGGKNFRFVNSTESDIVIGAHVDESKMTLTCTIYGTPLPDGQKIKIRSEQTGSLEDAAEELVLDESLPYNTRIVERKARRGKTSRTYKEYYDAAGEFIRRVTVYEDTYRSIPARVLVSTDIYYS